MILGLALVGSITAHAALVSSDPADGATITSPYTLTATFDDELTVGASSIVIGDSSGAVVTAGSVSPSDNHTLTVELPLLPAGTYKVNWTAVSLDDAAVERGTYSFSVATASTTPTPTPVVVTPATGGGSDLLIALVLAGVAIGAVVLFVVLRGQR